MPELPELGPVQTGGFGTPTSVGAATAGGRALAGFGQDLQRIAQQAESVIAEEQRAVAEGEMADARLGLQMAMEQHKLFRQENPDESAWEGDFANRIAGVKSSFGSKKLHPRDQERMGRLFEQFGTAGQIGVRADASASRVTRARGKSEQLIENYRKAGDVESAVSAYDDGVEAGLYHPDPELREMNVKAWQTEKEHQDVLFALDEDPVEVSEILAAKDGEGNFLNYPDFSKQERSKYLERAERKVASFKREAIQGVAERLESEDITSEEQVTTLLEKEGFLSDADRKGFLKNWRMSQPLDLETRTRITDEFNENHRLLKSGEIDLAEYRKRHDELGQEVYGYGARDFTGGLRQRLHALNPDKWSEGVPVSEQDDPVDVSSKIRDVEMLAKQWQKDGGFGGNGENPVENQKALVRRRQVEEELAEWIKSNSEAKLGEIQEQFQKRAGGAFTDDIFSEPENAYDNFSEVLPKDFNFENPLLPPINGEQEPGQELDDDGGEFAFEKEARLDSQGRVQVYEPPSADKNSMEIAGFGNVTAPEKFEQLKALVDDGKHDEAKSLAKSFYTERASSFTQGANSQVAKVITGVVTHRGEGGTRSIFRKLGISSAAEIEEIASQPGFVDRWMEAREKQERENEEAVWKSKGKPGTLASFRASREKEFGKGLRNRWRDEAQKMTS